MDDYPITNQLVVLAIGGNSLITDPLHQTVRDQYLTCLQTCAIIAHMLEKGFRIIITHGNGPQVGFILRRAELAAHELHLVPLDSCVADTQGAIGYQIQLGLFNQMAHFANRPPVVTVLTQIVVDVNDPAFSKPSKPIGSFLDQQTAEKRVHDEGWQVVEDANRGFRRVVPSPEPLDIIELEIIRKLVDSNYVVVAAGGGGIPVVRQEDGTLTGVEAVIDKDKTSSLLARGVQADILIISTSVECIFLNFGCPDQKPLPKLSVDQAKKLAKEGHFKAGSMLPKVQAACEFVAGTGKQAIITDPPHMLDAIRGKAGSRIVQ